LPKREETLNDLSLNYWEGKAIVKKTSEKNRSQSKERGTSTLSSALEKNLSAYAIAAGSAGVALLACAQSADAKVVITKVNIPVPVDRVPVQFDINGGGQMDFALSAYALGGCTSTSARAKPPIARPPLGCGGFNDELRVLPAQAANEVWQAGTSWGYNCAAALGRGARIDRLRAFAPGLMVMYGNVGSSEGHQVCLWKGSTPAKPYLGVKFLDKEGQLHYGWVRVTNNFISATITGYAYETIPNKPILAGAISEEDEAALMPSNPAAQISQPATLGHLALGATGLAAWRRGEEGLATSNVTYAGKDAE
jgi:hypothetical protein